MQISQIPFLKNDLKSETRTLKNAMKYLYHISVKDKEYFYMAGICQPWNIEIVREVIQINADFFFVKSQNLHIYLP